jgi:Cu-processing system permease protein
VRATLVIARHVLQESVRRRVFAVVLLLTLLFLALFVLASIKAFATPGQFAIGTQDLVGPSQLSAVTSVTLLAVFLTLGAIRGDAERGLLQPLVVRPLGRRELLLGRFIGAVGVCIAYITVLYAAVLVIVHQTGGRWPDHIVGPGLALIAAIVILVAMSLLGSVYLSATANGIAMFMLYGAGLVAGLLASIGVTLGAQTVLTVAHDIEVALPFEGFYSAALHALGSNQTGLARVIVNVGPFGSSNAGSTAFDVWGAFYLAVIALMATVGFERRDL